MVVSKVGGYFTSYDANGFGDDRCYLHFVGITRSVSCACQLANSHLTSMDRMCCRTLRQNVSLYKRYIDDILVVYDTVSVDSLLRVLSSFGQGIVCTHDESEMQMCVSFLDL